MKVSELLEALEGVNPDCNIYLLDGTGVKSAKLINRLNLVGHEQFFEIISVFDNDHTPELEDTLIERNTGFKTRERLIEAYVELKARMDGLEK